MTYMDKLFELTDGIYNIEKETQDLIEQSAKLSEQIKYIQQRNTKLVEDKAMDADKDDKSLSTVDKRKVRVTEMLQDDENYMELVERRYATDAHVHRNNIEVRYLKRLFRIYEISVGGGTRGDF